MKAKLFILIVFAGLFFACDKSELDSDIFRFGEETGFQQNQTYHSVDGHLSFRIDSITDSRCPVGVYCIWSGEARVFLSVHLNQVVRDTISTLDDAHYIQNYKFELVDVLPYPDLSVQQDAEKRVVIMKVSRGND